MERNVNSQDIYADGSGDNRSHNKNSQNKNNGKSNKKPDSDRQ